MKTIHYIKFLSFLLAAAFIFSCSSDDDSSIPEVETGFFPVQITMSNSSGDSSNVHLVYNSNNQLTSIQQDNADINGVQTYTFSYTGRLISHIGLNTNEAEVSYTASDIPTALNIDGGGTMTITYNETQNSYELNDDSGGDPRIVDLNANNVIESFNLYGSGDVPVRVSPEQDGVFKELDFQPVLSILLSPLISLYLFSPSAVLSIDNSAYGGGTITVENSRDAKGCITSATFSEGGSEIMVLDIIYEERELVQE